VKQATPPLESSALGNLGDSSDREKNVHFRPSVAFSSGWESSGSEGHESFFGRKKTPAEQTNQGASFQIRRLNFPSAEHTSQQSPQSFRRPAIPTKSSDNFVGNLSSQAAMSDVSMRATAPTSYRSPRLSPLHQFESSIKER